MYDDKNTPDDELKEPALPNTEETVADATVDADVVVDVIKEETHSYEYSPEAQRDANTAEQVLNAPFEPKPTMPQVAQTTEFRPIAPPQPNYYQSGWQTAPPQQQPTQPSQPPQQTQWTFNDYGPMGVNPKPPKKPKQPKSDKKPRSANFGLKVFAVVMSLLFVFSIVGFGGYIAYDLYQNPKADSSGSKGNDKPGADTDEVHEPPALDIGQTPDSSADQNKDGKLSGREINDKVSASVVGVAVYAKTTGFQLVGQGSGIVMTADGYIITNAHVVSSETANIQIAKIEVILNDGATFDATLVGGDLKTDLAVLKINTTGLTPAEFGDSDQLRVGDSVYVIGNPSGLEYAGSFTQGAVSSLSRNIYMQQLDSEVEYIQTDAAINPGNSGGAFINEYGQVVGISSAKLSAEGYEGMGFAIPINNAKDVIDSLIKNGYVSGRPKIGIEYKAVSETLAELNAIPKGLRVYGVEPDSDAAKMGVQLSDIIFKMDGKDVYDSVTIAEALADKKPGDKVELTIYRVDTVSGKSATLNITVTLGEMTPEPMQ